MHVEKKEFIQQNKDYATSTSSQGGSALNQAEMEKTIPNLPPENPDVTKTSFLGREKDASQKGRGEGTDAEKDAVEDAAGTEKDAGTASDTAGTDAVLDAAEDAAARQETSNAAQHERISAKKETSNASQTQQDTGAQQHAMDAAQQAALVSPFFGCAALVLPPHPSWPHLLHLPHYLSL